MINRDSRKGNLRAVRTLNTRIQTELLIGPDWEVLAHAELKRLALEVGTYHTQLEDAPGHEETGRAVIALNAACRAIEECSGAH
ncbi:MAG: hypothetical protein HN738_07950 [Gammaproteobacteria bacterium]|jgi:hypothetical protein|nr:hypothetical protein [Gammaproteobacteria bacterium]MBT6892817.1 hypothetical protein [Gammaproteobacteria bacterium]MBT7877999.1 hypothetical protein [Gammaproteobacteria bacterium]